MIKRLFLCFSAVLLSLILTGCMFKTVDELYTLPRHSDEYYNLQAAIDRVMTPTTNFSAPVSGTNQQSVQLADLDGDGEDEAVVFLKNANEKPLQVCIFNRENGEYQSVAVIEGSGSAFASCEYVQLDDTPGAELILCLQLSDSVSQSMSVYSLHDGHVVELMSAPYSEYTTTDLDGDGQKDLFLLRFDAEQRSCVAELYRSHAGFLEREPEASLSAGVQSVKRIITGNLMPNVPAVFVSGISEDDAIITDVFAFCGGNFQNVTVSGNFSMQTVHSYFVFASDIDFDGLIELPELIPIPSSDDTADAYSLIRWYNLDLKGTKTVKMTTYHRFSSGWYLVLPDAWKDQITISRSEEVSGVRGLVFSRWMGSAPSEPIFTVYAFSGDDRNQVASENGRFILSEKGEITYAAELGSCEWARELTREQLKQMFNYIHVDWNSGET